MSDRFFVENAITGDRAILGGPEAHHLAHVMRAEVGQRVVLFDGSGDEFQAEVKQIGRSEVQLQVLQRRTVDRESAVCLTVAVALPKGERQRWLVEKAVELGVAKLIPLAVQRGVAQPTLGALDRLRRSVIEASKQCGRNRLMEISAPQSWPQMVATQTTGQRWLAHPGGTGLNALIAAVGSTAQLGSVLAAVGPEGGFTDEEVQLGVAQGWTLVDLGPRILRVETAVVAIAAGVGQLG